MLWRILGPERALLWMGLCPDELGRFVERIGEFAVGLTKAQIRAADGLLDGMVIWGDVAYRKDLLFSPGLWRRHFKPVVKAIVDECHAHGLPVIYHGCGNAKRIFDDFIEVGVDVYNPLEAKAGFDVVDLRRKYGHRIGFCGNMDVGTWARGSEEELERVVLTKLNAAKGGGYIFQSDHSVPDNISGRNYDDVVGLVREYGRYPLRLGECDLPDIRLQGKRQRFFRLSCYTPRGEVGHFCAPRRTHEHAKPSHRPGGGRRLDLRLGRTGIRPGSEIHR
jgi:uroporphyrinogen-III decarboxylase